MSLKSVSVALLLSATLLFSRPEPAKAADPNSMALAFAAACGIGLAAMATLSGPMERYQQKRRIRKALEERGKDSSNLDINLELALRLLRNVPEEEEAVIQLVREAETPELLTANLNWHIEHFEATPDGFFDPQPWIYSVGARDRVLADLQAEGWKFFAVRPGEEWGDAPIVVVNKQNKLVLVRLKPQAAPLVFELLQAGLMIEGAQQLSTKREKIYGWVCDKLLDGFQPCDPVTLLQAQLNPDSVERVMLGPNGSSALLVNMEDSADELINAIQSFAKELSAHAESRRLSEMVTVYLVTKYAYLQTLWTYRSVIGRRLEFRGRDWDKAFLDAVAVNQTPEEYASRAIIKGLGFDNLSRAEAIRPLLVKAKFQDFF